LQYVKYTGYSREAVKASWVLQVSGGYDFLGEVTVFFAK